MAPMFPRLLLPRLLPRRLARFLPRWDGHNIHPTQVYVPRLRSNEATNNTKDEPAAVPLLPWGFVSPATIRERVAPLRKALTTTTTTTKPAQAQQQQQQQQEESGGDHDYYQTSLLGTHQTNPEVAELFAALQADFADGARQAYLAITGAFLDRRDFTEMSYCSPDLSLFLKDVRASYSKRNVEPRLTVHSVTARLVALRLEHGFLCDNRHFLGLMGKREAWHHFLVGAAGPEAALIQELNNGDFPRRLTAEVEFDVHETFQLIPRGLNATSTSTSSLPSQTVVGGEEDGGAGAVRQQHYFTFESDFVRSEEPEWQVSNINDAIKSPSLSSLLMMCGAAAASS